MDEEYYQEFLEGNQDGFEQLVLKYKNHLIYFIRRYVNDIYEAEDLAQDAFVDVYVYKERFHFKSSFKTYLFTIGRNKAIDYIRKQNRIILTDSIHDLADSLVMDNEIILSLIQKEEEEELYKAIYGLKPEYQVVLDLIDLEGLSYKEAAEVTCKSVAQIRILIHRARKALKIKLSPTSKSDIDRRKS